MQRSNRRKMVEPLGFDTFDAWLLIERYARACARIRSISRDLSNASKGSLNKAVSAILIAIHERGQ